MPEIMRYFNKQPIGLNPHPEEIILKKYYEIMVYSKQKGALNFLATTLNLKKEINCLYL